VFTFIVSDVKGFGLKIGLRLKEVRKNFGVSQLYDSKGAITSKIKHAIKLKTSPARLAQLLQPSLAFCFSLQPMTAYRPHANEGCNSCATVVQVLQDLF